MGISSVALDLTRARRQLTTRVPILDPRKVLVVQRTGVLRSTLVCSGGERLPHVGATE